MAFEFKDDPVTDYEHEVLLILIEEAAEVQQRATKAIRFGPKEIQPGQDFNNVERLSAEIGDLLVMIEMATEAGLIDAELVEQGKTHKHKHLAEFMKTYND